MFFKQSLLSITVQYVVLGPDEKDKWVLLILEEE